MSSSIGGLVQESANKASSEPEGGHGFKEPNPHPPLSLAIMGDQLGTPEPLRASREYTIEGFKGAHEMHQRGRSFFGQGI